MLILFDSVPMISPRGLSMNQITVFPSDSLKQMTNLTFLSLDDNLLTSVSKRNLQALSDSQLIHL